MRRLLPACLMLLGPLGACTLGPDWHRPVATAPADFAQWHAGGADLRAPLGDAALSPAPWWQSYGDATLDALETRALAANPDLRQAMLAFAGARLTRQQTAAAAAPLLDAKAGISRQRQSENGASTRLFDTIGAGNRDRLAQALAEPFTLWQGGFDAGWEPDLWGKARRATEAADAGVAERAALLAQTQQVIAGEVAQDLAELRAARRALTLARADIADARERLDLDTARVAQGIGSGIDLERERAALAASEAQIPALSARAAADENALTLLLGQNPGTLPPIADMATPALPDLALGLPGDLALRRPDILAAEARLHAATARIGVARADLYPAIRLGAGFDLDSYRSSHLFDWGSRSWSIGPSLDLPLFDGGRRKAVLHLRETEQQEAALAWEDTVLKAWHEIDNALSAYAAQRQMLADLTTRDRAARAALDLVTARQAAGAAAWTDVLDARHAANAAARDLSDATARLIAAHVAVQMAIAAP